MIDLRHGDALDVLPTLTDASIDAVVCDPPYALGFMGKTWDTHTPAGFQAWCQAWAAECLRVLKPGGYLLAFGGTRTVHRLTSAIEDAGFEIRDGIDWLYGSGFPKSLDVSKAIDKAAGAEREVIGERRGGAALRINGDNPRPWHERQAERGGAYDVTAPATDDARRWSGWGTALKPAREPIVVARKPLAGTVAANVLTYGTGALNIDACRIPAGQDYADKCSSVVGLASNRNGDAYGEWTGARTDSTHPNGRWPTNVILSHAGNDVDGDLCADRCVPGCSVAELDRQSGHSVSSDRPRHNTAEAHNRTASMGASSGDWVTRGHVDSGGASRFFPTFRYQAKAPARERPRVDGVAHPTVKPLALMRWLVTLVTPPGGVVLDPFAGSGTTVEACQLDGHPCIAIEREAEYLPLIRQRVDRSAPAA